MAETGILSEALVARAQAGDQEAMDELLTSYKGLVLRLSRARFLVGGDKDDLIQEGMIGLYKAIRDYDPEAGVRFSSFAVLCIDRQMLHAIEASRREKNRILNDSISLTGEEWESAAHTPDPEGDPEAIVLGQSDLSERLKELRIKLSPLEERVLDLCLAGEGYREIAEILGKEPKSIDNAIQRIRKKSKLSRILI